MARSSAAFERGLGESLTRARGIGGGEVLGGHIGRGFGVLGRWGWVSLGEGIGAGGEGFGFRGTVMPGPFGLS